MRRRGRKTESDALNQTALLLRIKGIFLFSRSTASEIFVKEFKGCEKECWKGQEEVQPED